MIYSFEQITRENSPIENVVLDLSANIGGAVRSAAYVIALRGSFMTERTLQSI